MHKGPYLREIRLASVGGERGFPLSLPAFSPGISLSLSSRVVFFVGENGSGKSTLLEAIAASCGFGLSGGNRNHAHFAGNGRSALADSLVLSWLPKVVTGFFLRAETFFNFASVIDAVASTDPSVLESYGGKSLHAQSHGESFLSLFANHFNRAGLFLLDEPEAALSPARQLSFLRILHELDVSGRAQFIIATHSPIILSYPGAQIFQFGSKGICPVEYSETDHYQITRAFLDDPRRFFSKLFD